MPREYGVKDIKGGGMNFAANFKKARMKLGLGQVELAKKIGIDQRAISNYETGLRKPRIARIPIIARALNVSIDELVK